MERTRSSFQPGATHYGSQFICELCNHARLKYNEGVHRQQRMLPKTRPHCASSVILAPSSDVAGLHHNVAHKPCLCESPWQSQAVTPGIQSMQCGRQRGALYKGGGAVVIPRGRKRADDQRKHQQRRYEGRRTPSNQLQNTPHLDQSCVLEPRGQCSRQAWTYCLRRQCTW